MSIREDKAAVLYALDLEVLGLTLDEIFYSISLRPDKIRVALELLEAEGRVRKEISKNGKIRYFIKKKEV